MASKFTFVFPLVVHPIKTADSTGIVLVKSARFQAKIVIFAIWKKLEI
jgi:hypothetical protein